MVRAGLMIAWCLLLGGAVVASPRLAVAAAPKAEADPHAGGDHAAHAGSTDPLSFDPDLAIFTVIVFLLLLLILAKFAWKPLMHALEEREQRIADNIAAAERVGEEARRSMALYETKLAGAADEVRKLLEEARRDAEHTKASILAEGKQAAQVEMERATREIQTATDAALKTLGEKSAQLAVDLAGKIIHQKLSPLDHQNLIKDAVAKFAASEPSSN